MEGGAAVAAGGDDGQAPMGPPPPPPKVVEGLNPAVQRQLNLKFVKTRAIGLFKAISRILEEFDAIARTNSTPKWQDALGQFSMVNLELFKIVDDIKKVSKAFVVYPKNLSAENARILHIMLASKLLPEMEAEDKSKREQLLYGMQKLPVTTQIAKLKARLFMIRAVCESAVKIIADARKDLNTRQGPTTVPAIDKVHAAKIHEQETLLRAAVMMKACNLRVLPSPMPSNIVNNQDTAPQFVGRSVPSRSGATGITSFENTTTCPLPYANSPRSGTNIINTPSPQQWAQQQRQPQQQQ